MRNNKGAIVATSYTMQVTKSLAGNFVNSLDVPSQYMPGNFGIRAIETMPTNFSDVYRDRLNTNLGFICDEKQKFIPELLEDPQ
jgi:hypothetical protein